MTRPVSLLREDLAIANAKANLWKKLMMAAVVVSIISFAVAVAVVAVGGAYARELSAYRLRCVDYESTEVITDLATTIIKVNDACFALHKRNIANLEETFPGVFDTSEGKRLRYMYEVADE